MHRTLIGILFCVAAAQSDSLRRPPHAILHFRSQVQDKNFYLFSLIEQTPAVKRAVRSDGELARLAADKRAALRNAAESCAAALACYADAIKFSDREIDAVSGALKRLYGGAPEMAQMVEGPLRESGLSIRYHPMRNEELLARAWTDAAHGLNGVIDVYGLGRPPRYPAIDSVSYDVESNTYGRLVSILTAVLNEDSARLELFFQPTLRFSLGLLDANHRDEAGRFEPLDSGENRAAIRRIGSIDWGRYPYSAIIVPGAGNERADVSLSPWGKLRLTLAVRRFREGKAPFLLVSGGFVHPNQTKHCEAIEMKKSLMTDFAIPEDAILIDPQARHTTTNLRNAVRELYRYGMPFAKPGLITTDQDQSAYISGSAFEERCSIELGYQPVLKLQRISQFDLTFSPNMESLQSDARDPLDP
jgi:hypothetical protein